MPKVSINILTRNRSWLLLRALNSVAAQSFKDYEVIVINNGSTDNTAQALEAYKNKHPLKVVSLPVNIGITAARQKALEESKGDYIAILDDDDEWTEPNKLKLQVEYLDENANFVLVGGGIEFRRPKSSKSGVLISAGIKLRPKSDRSIRASMLFRNNFFTSTVMFRKSAAVKVGGFIKDDSDLAEDYDLWLRMGNIGGMHNFAMIFTQYTVPDYNKDRSHEFLAKQLSLIKREKNNYSFYWLAWLILELRLQF